MQTRLNDYYYLGSEAYTCRLHASETGFMTLEVTLNFKDLTIQYVCHPPQLDIPTLAFIHFIKKDLYNDCYLRFKHPSKYSHSEREQVMANVEEVICGNSEKQIGCLDSIQIQALEFVHILIPQGLPRLFPRSLKRSLPCDTGYDS